LGALHREHTSYSRNTAGAVNLALTLLISRVRFSFNEKASQFHTNKGAA
jgi:hypothetical protein